MNQGLATRVLVVEDNVELLQVLCFLLESEGFAVDCISDPATALLSAISAPPQICLIDMGLPGMDGYELAADLRRIAPQALLVGMSGSEKDIKRDVQTGMCLSSFLNKPFSAEALFEVFAFAQERLRTSDPLL